jgi:two-component system response regulator YesN
MHKVIIADDEIWIRRGLIKKIAWQHIGLELSAEAENGRDALEALKQEKPDILLCDVRMPGLDGLQLSKKAREILPHIQIIIISGYEDFNYAKDALNFGAIGYLLKPLDKAEVNSFLKRAVKNLEAQSKTGILDDDLKDLSEKVLQDLIFNDDEYYINKANEWFCDNDKDDNEFASAIIRIDTHIQDSSKIKKRLDKKFSARKDLSKRIVFFLKDTTRIGIFIQLYKGYITNINSLINKIYLYLESEKIPLFKIGVGLTFSDFSKFKDSLSTASKVLEELDFSTAKKIVFYENETQFYKNNYFPYKYLKDFLTAVDTCDRDGTALKINEIEEFVLKHPHFSIKTIRRLFFTLTTEIMKRMMEEGDFDNEIIDEGYVFCNSINNYSNFSELKVFLFDYSIKTIQKIEQNRKGSTSSIVLNAKKYIDNNYNKKLTLNKIADMFNINPAYFCSKFKEITGRNYHEYITSIRVEKAKKMLTENDMTVTKIAKLVGYDDSRYFSKIFKKCTGFQPSKFKQSLEHENI